MTRAALAVPCCLAVAVQAVIALGAVLDGALVAVGGQAANHEGAEHGHADGLGDALL